MQEKESMGAKFRSFMEGIAFIGGALDPLYPYQELNPKDADTNALRSDWEAVLDKEIINNDIGTKGQEKPFRWGDEKKVPEVKPELEEDGCSHTSIAELLEEEEGVDKKRLEEYITKQSIINI